MGERSCCKSNTMSSTVLIVVSLFITGTHSRLVPSFALSQDRSFDGSPRVSISFPDGYTDTMVLSRYYSNENDRLARTENCHFFGHLEGEPEACIALTGCPGSDDLELTIMSEHSNNPTFKWKKDGEVELIESPFLGGKARSEKVRKLDGEWTVEGDDELVNPTIKNAEMELAKNDNAKSVQSTNLLTLKFGYGDGFLGKTGSHANAKAYIQATLPHMQTLYCHSASLGTKIQLEISEIKHFSGKNFKATVAMAESLETSTASEVGTADLVAYMGYDTETSGIVGIAAVSSVCMASAYNGQKISINEWQATHAAAGQLVAHEVGHNLGMYHDFDNRHSGKGCDKTGVMSYGGLYTKWSTCSKSDFAAHVAYVAQMGQTWSACMPTYANACNGGTTTTTTALTTTGSGSGSSGCVQWWIGDGFCDPENNKKACKFDGGDCCAPYAHPHWDWSCKWTNQCICKK